MQDILRGDQSAFQTLVNQHKNMVYSIALRISKNPQIAEELAQDVFLRVYEKLRDFKHESKLKTWIYRIAINWCLTKTRQFKKWESVSYEEHHQEFESSLDSLETLEIEQRALCVRQALAELDDMDAIVITLFYLEEMSIQEIVETTNFSQGNIKVKLHRARKKLVEVIESKHQHLKL